MDKITAKTNIKKVMDQRENIILPYIKDKVVLDLGPGDLSYRFLHKFIRENSAYSQGLELDEKRAKKLRAIGYNIQTADVEKFKINRKFDAIIAGDLIEHLNNPGLMLENIKKHLKKDGVFIVTTPNIYSINYLLRGILSGGNVKHFSEHTYGFTEQLLKELFRRHELKIIRTIYFNQKEKGIKNLLTRILSSPSKKLRENMILVGCRI